MENIEKYCLKVNTEFPIKEEMQGTYDWNNGKVAFVDDKGDYYVTPFCFEVRDALLELGYKQADLPVYYSNWDTPKDPEEAKRWEVMCEQARELHDKRRELNYQEEYAPLAEKAGITELPQEVYAKSFKIPREGLDTIFLGERDFINPDVQYNMEEDLGCYYQNNGKVAFIDETGNVYVTPFSSDVKDLLEQAGYKEQSIYVPLSNQEDIADPELDAQWKNMCEEAREKFEEQQEEQKTM